MDNISTKKKRKGGQAREKEKNKIVFDWSKV